MEDDTEKVVAIENGGSEDGGGSRSHWWWALGGATQLGWGITSVVRGYGGDSRFMILKAFSVASLFVGGAASTSMAALHASGIRKVEDLIEVGANIRTGLGVPQRTHTAKYVIKSLGHFPFEIFILTLVFYQLPVWVDLLITSLINAILVFYNHQIKQGNR